VFGSGDFAVLAGDFHPLLNAYFHSICWFLPRKWAGDFNTIQTSRYCDEAVKSMVCEFGTDDAI